MDPFLQAAVEEAKKSLEEGGIPTGAVLVVDGQIVGQGYNRCLQQGSLARHAVIDCLENAGRLQLNEYQQATLYTTLSPCAMCCGVILLYQISRVIIGENQTIQGPEDYLLAQGVELEVLNDPACIDLIEFFVQSHPEAWIEYIGS